MNIREAQLQKCFEERDERIAQLEEKLYQLSNEADILHRTIANMEKVYSMYSLISCQNIKRFTLCLEFLTEQSSGRGHAAYFLLLKSNYESV